MAIVLNKIGNDDSKLVRPRPSGLSAAFADCVALYRRATSPTAKCALSANAAESQSLFRLNQRFPRFSNIIHACMQDVLGIPEDKRAHRFIPLNKEDFYYPGGRSNAYTVIEINMMAGRHIETQKKLIKSLFKEIESQLAISSTDIEIVIKEQAPYQWGFRGMTGDEARDLSYDIKI